MPFLRLIDLSCSERLTLWVIRRVARERSSRCLGQRCPIKNIFWPCFREDFDDVADALADAFLRGAEGPISIAAAGTACLTAVEIALLEATGLFQAGDNEKACQVLGNVIGRRQAVFARAMSMLAERLASAGHLLPWEERRVVTPMPLDGWTERAEGPSSAIGAAALATARRQGHIVIGESYVMWPRPAR